MYLCIPLSKTTGSVSSPGFSRLLPVACIRQLSFPGAHKKHTNTGEAFRQAAALSSFFQYQHTQKQIMAQMQYKTVQFSAFVVYSAHSQCI